MQQVLHVCATGAPTLYTILNSLFKTQLNTEDRVSFLNLELQKIGFSSTEAADLIKRGGVEKVLAVVDKFLWCQVHLPTHITSPKGWVRGGIKSDSAAAGYDVAGYRTHEQREAAKENAARIIQQEEKQKAIEEERAEIDRHLAQVCQRQWDEMTPGAQEILRQQIETTMAREYSFVYQSYVQSKEAGAAWKDYKPAARGAFIEVRNRMLTQEREEVEADDKRQTTDAAEGGAAQR